MNYRMICYLLGKVLLLLAVLLLLPCAVALIYGEGDFLAFLYTAGVSALMGGLLQVLRPQKRNMRTADGFVMVSLCWILISLVGALPFTLHGSIPSYLDAVFETVSGFTTTGSSILSAPELLPHGLLFWRSFTHWIGGMGVLVFMLAIVPMSGDSIYLLRAESPGPSVSKMVPKMRTSSLILYGIYLGLTVLQFLLFQLGRICGWGEMSVFDSLCITLGTAGTGGFAISSSGMANYSVYEQVLTTVFMILCGVNFSIYFFLLCGKFRLIWQNSEVKTYFSVIFVAITLITANLLSIGFFDSFGTTLRHVSFSVGSLITSTGYGTADFSQWPEFSRVVLLIVMVIGACAGSTGGGMKVSRILILGKTLRAELHKLLHPHAVVRTTMDGKQLSREAVRGTQAYLVAFMTLFLCSMFVLSLEDLGIETTLSATLTTLNNMGPGTSAVVGPFGGFGGFSALSKLTMIFNMLLGRLEIFPVLLLLRPSTWRKN